MSKDPTSSATAGERLGGLLTAQGYGYPRPLTARAIAELTAFDWSPAGSWQPL